MKYHAIRHLRTNSQLKAGDTLVLFGELFTRGYANGFVEAAQAQGINIIYSTVGRREKDGSLRGLTEEEIALQPKPFINVPLEAGFDMELDSNNERPIDVLAKVKLSDWQEFQYDKAVWAESVRRGRLRFSKQVKAWVDALRPHLPSAGNVVFAHLMAGGVPRTKIVMPLMNRAFKGAGDRHLSSEVFWNSSIGQLVAASFFDVTAETFQILHQETKSLRTEFESRGNKVVYTAYGYHGTEVLVGNNYLWQTYTPYLQGFAKMRLENYARDFSEAGSICTVYNCPEILTNSSAIFNGVEVSLYPLLGALLREAKDRPKAQHWIRRCSELLKPEVTLAEILNFTDQYLRSSVIREHCQFDKWPQHNSQVQMDTMLSASEHLIGLHKNEKELMTGVLSELVFEACGKVMLADCAQPESPVAWINHDIIARLTSAD